MWVVYFDGNARNILRYITATYKYVQVQLSVSKVRNQVLKWVKTPSYTSATAPVESLRLQNPP